MTAGAMRKAVQLLQKLENLVLAAAFVIMTLSAFAQVVNRNLIGAGISWFEELARYSMVYMTLLGTEIGLRDGSQLSITAVTDRFGSRGRRLLRILGKLVVTAYAAVIFRSSFTLLEKQLSSGQFSPGLGAPMYIPYAALPLSFGVITIVQALAAVALAAEPFFGRPGAAEGEAA